MSLSLNNYSKTLFKFFIKDTEVSVKQGITVNPIVSEIASWYEKLRNAMEYRQDEVILQSTITRILKRRVLLGGKEVGAHLVRELVWARYLPDGSITEETIRISDEKINLYLKLKKYIIEHRILKEGDAYEWIFDLMSSDLEDLLNPHQEREAMGNYIFHALSPNITLENETEEVKNLQLFIAVRRSYARENLALLRYSLFKQYFGELTPHNYQKVENHFKEAHAEIESSINYPRRYKISNYVKRYIPPFLILEDMLRTQEEKIYSIIENEEELSNSVITTCEIKYKGISSKVRRAIVRSVFFILISKVIFAFVIEGTFERYVYGDIQWLTLTLNIIIPVSLMIIASFFISTPGRKNSLRILQAIRGLLFSEHPTIGQTVMIADPSKKKVSFSDNVFTTLWLTTFLISFGLIIYALTLARFNFVSQGIFLFFIAIISFLTYRISQTAHVYTLEDKQNIKSLIADFFFLPIARVGRHLTEGISQINILLFLFDYVIETPFKGLFGFFDQWFLYLHSKRENLE